MNSQSIALEDLISLGHCPKEKDFLMEGRISKCTIPA